MASAAVSPRPSALAQVVEAAGDGQRRRGEDHRARAGVEALRRIGPTSIGEACRLTLRADATIQRTCSRPPAVDQHAPGRRAARAARRAERRPARSGAASRARPRRRRDPARSAISSRTRVQLVVAGAGAGAGPQVARARARASRRRPGAAGGSRPRSASANASAAAGQARRPSTARAARRRRAVARPRSRAEREQPLRRDVHAEELGRHVLDLVRLVEDHRLVRRQHLRLGPARAQRQVGEEQVVVDDDHLRVGGAAPHVGHEAALEVRAARADARLRAWRRCRATRARRRGARPARRGRRSATLVDQREQAVQHRGRRRSDRCRSRSCRRRRQT